MRSVNRQEVALHTKLTAGVTKLTIIDFLDGHWRLDFGWYGHLYSSVVSTEDIATLTSVLSAMLIENEQEMAAISGDFENESKMDVLNTEAWLDKEG